MSEGTDLRDLFRRYQAEMDKGLSKCRSIKHSTTQGDETESCWSKWFSDSLPARYQIKKGIVVDSKGGMSDQIDIIIFDQHYSPFLFKGELSVYVPAESVYAVFEVKPTINKYNIEYAGSKVASVRRLRRTNAPIVHAGGRIDNPNPPLNILGGILSYGVEWKKPYGPAFSKIMESRPIDERLDIGCSIAKGAFEARYGEGGMELVIETEDSLIFFLLRLLSRLQGLGTVPAIDLNEYLRLIKS